MRGRCTITSVMILLTGALAAAGPLLAQEGAVAGVHDPCIIREGKAFYVFSTGGGLQIRKSTDLGVWRKDGQVMNGIPDWAKRLVPAARSLWAPDISFFNGKYYLYYAVSSWGSNRSCIGLATSRTLDRASALFGWVDEGLVIASEPGRDDFNAIDPACVLDQEGRPWLAFGSFWSGIHIFRINIVTGKPTGPPIRIAGRDGGAVEAPFLVLNKEYFYLFLSFDRCCKGAQSTYKIMVGRSRSVDGPYLDRDGNPLLHGGGTLVIASHGRFRGPGHNAVLREPGADYLVHHFYDADAGGRPTLQIRPLIWGPDGWPRAGELDGVTRIKAGNLLALP